MDAEPVPTAKMRAEAIWRNSVASITSALVPRTMLMLPMLCAMAVPSFFPGMLVMFPPLGFMHMFRAVPLLVMWLLVFGSVVVCTLLVPPSAVLMFV